MNTAYLIIGSNKGNSALFLHSAIKYIEERVGKVIKQSNVFTTKAWGNTNQPDFLNQALLIETNLKAADLLKQLLIIEEELGRVRTEQKWMQRTIDIDILFYNNDIINTAELTIPHPYIQDRMFVLVPLAEIANTFIHPVLNKSIDTLIIECEDKLKVTLADEL